MPSSLRYSSVLTKPVRTNHWDTEYNYELHMIFVDLKQAYNSINKDQLWITLTNLGIPNKLIRMIKICNSNTLQSPIAEGAIP